MIDYGHQTIDIGKRVIYHGQLLEVVKQNGCTGCHFGNNPGECKARVRDFAIVGRCAKTRTDRTMVIFKPVSSNSPLK